MAYHVIDRLLERYGKNFTPDDVATIRRAVQKGRYLEVKDFQQSKGKVVFVKYNNIPLKLACSTSKKITICTALPLDIEEYNKYCDLVPEVGISLALDRDNNDKKELQQQFFDSFENKKFSCNIRLESDCKEGIEMNVKVVSDYYTILWYEKESETIINGIFSTKTLKRRLRQYIINHLDTDDISAVKNFVRLYEKLDLSLQ